MTKGGCYRSTMRRSPALILTSRGLHARRGYLDGHVVRTDLRFGDVLWLQVDLAPVSLEDECLR